MNWEAMGAVGEIVGATTVVATIFYLSLQIRQNTKSQSIAIIELSQRPSMKSIVALTLAPFSLMISALLPYIFH